MNNSDYLEPTTNSGLSKINLMEKGLNDSSIRSFNLCFIIKMTIMAAIGGFLFGYDTGVIGGANLYFHLDFPDITTSQKETIVSLTAFGAAVGCLLIGPISDNYGRKISIILSDFLFIIGAVMMYATNGISILMIGRFIVGLGIGGASMVVPIYLSEVSPTAIRGRIVTINNLFITSGQLIAYLIVLACGTNWRLMLGVSGVPALIQLFSMLFFPESPRWLMKMEKKEKADEVFGLIFKVNTSEGKKEMEYEIAQIQEAMEIEDVHVSQYTKYKELFTVYRKIVFIGVMLQVWQQLSGINTMMYYGPDVMLNAGFGSKDNQLSTLYASLPLSGLNCIGNIFTILVIDKLGRRYIMLRSLPGCGICMFLLGVGMALVNENVSNGKWVSAIAIFAYMFIFSVGMGATPWTVNSEIYPLHLRGIGNSMSTLGNWLSNYFVSAVFLTAVDSENGQTITYFVIGCFCFCAWLFIYNLLPETKGKTIEENIKNMIPNLGNEISNFNEREK